MKHYPYAPYIMHIIEQVLVLSFPTDAPHRVLKVSNKLSLQAKKELEEAAKGKAKGASGSTSRLLHHELHAPTVLIVRSLSPPPPPVVSPPASSSSS